MLKASDALIKLAGLNLPKTMFISDQKTEKSAKSSNRIVKLLHRKPNSKRVFMNHKLLMKIQKQNDVILKKNLRFSVKTLVLKLIIEMLNHL